MNILNTCHTIGARWSRSGLLFVAAGVVAVVSIGVSYGAKPGGGGSSIPPGTVYFRHAGTMWQMDAAGTPASRVPLATVRDYGDPSYARHGGQRWFAYDYANEGRPEYPQFPNGRYLRDIRAGSEAGEEILLFSAADIELISWANWATDDASITFLGERWELDAEGLPIAVDAGLYELFIDFSSGTPVAGPLEFVADLSDVMRAGPDGFPPYSDNAEIVGHSWNSDGTKIAFGFRINSADKYTQEIWIADIPSGTSLLLDSGGGVGWPQWSPDGSRIGYVSSSGTVVHELATGRKKMLRRTPSTGWEQTFWSPTGAYFAIGHWDNFLNGEDAIYRFTSDAGGKTELTAGLVDPLPHFNTYIPVGWRD